MIGLTQETDTHRRERLLYTELERLGIAWRTVHHAPAHTVDEARALRGDLPGGHAKNLFLKSKKGDYLLACVEETASVDVQALARATACDRLSFASPERLKEWLGLEPGSVTPFGLLHARHHPGQARLRVVLDERLARQETLWFHPLHNGATTEIASLDLIRLMIALGFPPLILAIPG
jgi:Ala-tRNA(Pro) deacylase